MSGKICRETYCNYGSYLRSRGYDKAICDLITMIENGKIPIGPFKPKDACNALIEGTLEIVECPSVPNVPGAGGPDNGTGQLWLMGGYAGEDTPSPAALQDLGLQVKHGQHTQGPVIQTRSIATAPNGAVIPGGDHKVNISGGLPGNPTNGGAPPLLPLSIPQLTNANYFEYDTIFTNEVHIGGNLLVDGSGTIQHGAEAETLLLKPFALQDQAKLKIFGINSTATKNKELVSVWHGDGGFISQANIESDWLNSLAFSIDGYPESPYVWGTASQFGQTGINGRTRALQGLTVTDPNYMGLNGAGALPTPPYLNATNADIQQNALDIRGNVLISAGSNGNPPTSTTPATLEFEAGSMINMQSQTPLPPVNIDKIISQVTPAPPAAVALVAGGNVNNTSLATTQAIKTYVDSVVNANNDLNFSGSTNSGTVDLSTQTFKIDGSNSNITTNAVPAASPGTPELTIALSPNLTNLTSVQTGELNLNSNAVTDIVVQGTATGTVVSSPGDDGKLVSEKALVKYIEDVNTGFTVAGPSPPGASVNINDGDTLNAVSGTNTTAAVITAGASAPGVQWNLNSVLNKIEEINGAGISGPGGYSLSIKSLSAASTPANNNINIELSPGATAGGGTQGKVEVTTGYMNIGAAPGNAQTAAGNLNVARAVTAGSFIGGTATPAGGANPAPGEISTSGFINIGAPNTPATATNNVNLAVADDATIDGELVVGGDAGIVGALTVDGAADIVGSLTLGDSNGSTLVADTPAQTVDLFNTSTGTINIGGNGSTVEVSDLDASASINAGSDVIVAGNIHVQGNGSHLDNLNTAGGLGDPLSNYSFVVVNNTNSTNGGLLKRSSNDITSLPSSLRYKENVEIMTEEAAGDLMKIMPRTFNYKGSNDETFGLIAEELAGTELKAAVSNDSEGRPDAINYSMLVAPLLRIVQDQNERIKALEEKVEALSK